MSRIDERLEAMKIDTSEMTTEQKFTAATGLTHYDEETAANDWYVPGGAANVLSEGGNEGGQEGGNEGGQDNPTVETYTAEEAIAYNAALDGARHEGDKIDLNTAVNYELIDSESAWNNSAVLPKYYALNPDEDRWNTTENRAGNFNDKAYVATIDGNSVNFAAHWETDDVQKITNIADENEVYYLAMFYSLSDTEYPLYTDVTLQTSANKTATFTQIKWNDITCPQCWQGALNAPGAKLPWVAINFTENVNAQIKFDYEGKDTIYPWGETLFGDPEANKDWALTSPAAKWEDDTFKLGTENYAFDTSKFSVTLVHVVTAEEAIAYNAELDGAVKEGDPKKASEIEVETQP